MTMTDWPDPREVGDCGWRRRRGVWTIRRCVLISGSPLGPAGRGWRPAGRPHPGESCKARRGFVSLEDFRQAAGLSA